MADSYEEYQPLRAPPWLQDDEGNAWERQFGRSKDELETQLREGVTARFPRFAVELGADDALDATGSERNLPRGPFETSAEYAERLILAWDAWALAGSHGALLRALKVLGFAPAMIVQDNGLYSFLDGDDVAQFGDLGVSVRRGRPDWRFDDRDTFWSRFAVLFPGPLPGRIQVTGTATFTGSDRATCVWSHAWDAADYLVASSAPVTAGPVPVVNFDSSTIAKASIELYASAAFTGTVDCIAWLEGSNPFASPSLSSRNLLRETVRLWKPGTVTYEGAIALVQGGVWGWPLGTWGEVGDVWDVNSVELIE